MRQLFATLLLVLFLPAFAAAQSNDSTQVMDVIKVFFDGLATQDSTMMLSASDPGARLVLTSSKADGTPLMRSISIDEFVNIIVAQEDSNMVETYWDPEIRIEDNLASVWLNYNFYVGESIDHCGEDNFQLFRSIEGWKIAAIADTQRRVGCEPE